MVNTGLNLGNDANIKQIRQTKDRNYHKVNLTNKGMAYFKIFHQNIRGLGKKPRELLSHLHPAFSHVLCLTEHHLKYSQLEKVHIEGYKLGAHFCRQVWEKDGVAIFAHNSLGFSNIDVVKHYKEQDIEICALKLSFGTLNICVLTLYRASSGNLSSFLHKLDTVLQLLYMPMLHFIICGDININYLKESEDKTHLDNILLSYNLINIINFLTRVQNTASTAIDSIFIDVSQFESYTVTPITNGLSDLDEQLLKISTEYTLAPICKFKTKNNICPIFRGQDLDP
jgi:exonuclease III